MTAVLPESSFFRIVQDAMRTNLADRIAELENLVADASVVAGFTGAGISTESGVPDFRSPDSPWMRHKPIPFEDFLGSGEARTRGLATEVRHGRPLPGCGPEHRP